MDKFKKLINVLYESRDKATVFHFNTDINAHHTAFDDYVYMVNVMLDELVEMYMGKYGPIGEYKNITNYNKETDYIKYFEELVDDLERNKTQYVMSFDVFLINKLDDIIGQIYRLLYKLKHIK